MEPTFAGLALFGPVPNFTRQDPPNAVQEVHYPGLRGTMRKNLGMAGARTMVRGILFGVDAGDLAAAQATIRAAKESGVMRVLIDTTNVAWPDAIIAQFRSTGRPVFAPGWGYGQTYELEIYHTGWLPPGS